MRKLQTESIMRKLQNTWAMTETESRNMLGVPRSSSESAKRILKKHISVRLSGDDTFCPQIDEGFLKFAKSKFKLRILFLRRMKVNKEREKYRIGLKCAVLVRLEVYY